MIKRLASRLRKLMPLASGNRPAAATESGSAARTARQMSALLASGIAPERVFQLLAQDASAGTDACELARMIAEGEGPVEALAQRVEPEWRVLAAAWQLAAVGGAPLSPAIARVGEGLSALERLRERRSVILAGPKSTVALVAALPPIALLMGLLLGFDPVPVFATPVGAMLLTAGALLLASGIAWARALQRRVETGDSVSGLECELAWIALRGGADPGATPRLVADAVDQVAAEWVPFDRFLADAPLRRNIAAASAAGVPLSPLLLEEAAAERGRAHARLEREAEQLGNRVLIPLAVCVLPAFILVGVVPVVLSMLRA